MTCFNYHLIHFWCFFQLAFTCSKTIMETLEQCVKYVQSYWKGHQSEVLDVALLSLLLTLTKIYTLFWFINCWLWAREFKLGLSWIGRRVLSTKNYRHVCVAAEKGIYPFGAWCPLKGYTYWNKLAAFSCRFI